MIKLLEQVKLFRTLRFRIWWRILYWVTLSCAQRMGLALITAVLSAYVDNWSYSAPSARVFHSELAGALGFEPRLAVLETALLAVEGCPYIYTG